MQTKNIVQKKAQDIFLYAAVSIGFLGATEVRGVAFEELYNVTSVESVDKPVEHSISLGNARTGRLRTRSLNGPTQLGLSVVSDNCLVGYALASSDETTSRYHIKVWLTKESIPVELVVGPARSAFLPGKSLGAGPQKVKTSRWYMKFEMYLKCLPKVILGLNKSVFLLSTVITSNDQSRLWTPNHMYI